MRERVPKNDLMSHSNQGCLVDFGGPMYFTREKLKSGRKESELNFGNVKFVLPWDTEKCVQTVVAHMKH